jgi:flavin reductase (DIM6/NTAB) family NADH-FMN oxidoreductase RutF
MPVSFDAQEFRKALGQFATGVAVITASDRAGVPIGMTISSFNSVSLDPPLVLFSVDRRALSLPAMLAEGYAVNLLSRRQEHLSNQFAKALSDKWQAVRHTLGRARAPLIQGALAHFECSPYAYYDGGGHVILLGRVLRFSTQPRRGPPHLHQGQVWQPEERDAERAPVAATDALLI